MASGGQPDGSGGEQVARRRLHGRSKRIRHGRALAGLGAGAIRGMTAGIARTEIATASEAGVNEVARLFEASINAADRFIYIENQFTSATDIAPCWRSGCSTCHSFASDRHAEDAFVLVQIAGHAERPRRIHRPVRGGEC